MNVKPSGSQWIPNYFLHLLGSGMEYRMMTEWYRYHKVPAPKLFSTLTILSTQFLNEVIENKDIDGTNIDPIADWYVFNVAGIIMFNSIKVNKFFSHTLNMADWSHMPTVSFRDYTLQNSGQYFIYKWHIPRNPKWALFSRWGMGTYAGVSYKIKNEHAITVSAGGKSHVFQIVDTVGKVSTTSLTWAVAGKDGSGAFGICSKYTLGLGLGYGWR